MKKSLLIACLASLAFSAAATDWTEWADYATATYDAHYWYRTPMTDLKVQRRTQIGNPKMEQYKVIGLFGDNDENPPIDLIINVNKAVSVGTKGDVTMWIDRQFVESFDIYGEKKNIYITDGYSYYEEFYPNYPQYAAQYEDASFFREETGTFNIYAYYCYDDGTVPFLDAFYKDTAQGEETLTLHGPQFKNYNFDMGNAHFDIVDGKNNLIFNAKLNDLSKVRATVVNGTVSDVRSVAEAMNNGTSDYVEITSEGTVYIPATNTAGTKTLVYLTYKADGTPYQFKAIEYSYDPDWNHLGQGTYTDGFISQFMKRDLEENLGIFLTEDDYTYPVDVQESKSTPGVYRIINPYGSTSPYWDIAFTNIKLDKTATHYLTINASNPERVYIEFSESGFKYGALPLELYSEAYDWIYDGYDPDKLPEYLWGKLKDGVITFDAGNEDQNLLAARIYYSPAPISGQALVLKLPSDASAPSIVTDCQSVDEAYYNLQGLKIAHPTPGNIYIVVKSDGSTSKRLIK